jgi:hypothetical protein
MMKRIIPMLLLASGALAQEHNHAKPSPSSCSAVSRACADKATPFFAKDGALWLAWSANGRIGVERSTDLGKSFSAAVMANHHAEKLDAGADSRPQIVLDGSGDVVVAYTVAKGADFAGQVLVARSTDGKTFTMPRQITDDGASQRFVTFALDPSGDVFAAWIDKRNLAAAGEAGRVYDGAALAFAWSTGGKDFAATRIAQDNTCECCRLGVAFAGPHKPAVMWRNMYPGGVRDHAVMTFDGDKPGPVNRVSVDGWKIDACPHQGPSLAIDAQGAYHATWFTEGAHRQGVFYARSTDNGKTFSLPMPVGNNDRQPTRPFVLAAGDKLWLAWKEFDGEQSTVSVMQSRDAGANWSKPRVVATTADASDHPLLIARDTDAFLSWLTRNEGYRLITLEKGP